MDARDDDAVDSAAPEPVEAARFDDADHAALWTRWRAGDRDAYEALVDAYLPLVKSVAGRMAMNLPAHVPREDLYAAGCVGLVSAFERFDPGREARFSTYATIRIRGAIMDELRAHDFLGRGARDRVQRVERATAELRRRNVPLEPERIAEAAGLTLDEYWDAEVGREAARRVSLSATSADGHHTLEDRLEDARERGPGAGVEMAELVKLVMDQLTPKERQLVVLYYDEGLTLKEIGQVMGVTESRVSQIHTAMTGRLRKKLESMGIFG